MDDIVQQASAISCAAVRKRGAALFAMAAPWDQLAMLGELSEIFSLEHCASTRLTSPSAAIEIDCANAGRKASLARGAARFNATKHRLRTKQPIRQRMNR
jgi:hypothetical protein